MRITEDSEDRLYCPFQENCKLKDYTPSKGSMRYRSKSDPSGIFPIYYRSGEFRCDNDPALGSENYYSPDCSYLLAIKVLI